MPLPEPYSGEDQDEFMSRCMSDDTMINEYPDSDQRYAICTAQWDENKGAMKTIVIPEFRTKAEKLDWLVQNKDRVASMKKEQIKRADCIPFVGINNYTLSLKAEGESNKDEITVLAIINTTNLMDSHDDVHLPGIWDKSLQENKMIMHLQEHKMEFAKIISDGDDLRAFTKMVSWKELGFNWSGQTQALAFESVVKRERNAYMFEQYRKGYVKNHSVGMRYVRLLLAVNDEKYTAEFEAWEKYYPEIANKERADELGYFWVVKEAKVIEGSAVPLGSNFATPTQSVKESAPSDDTQTDKSSAPLVNTLRDILKNEVKSFKF